MTRRGSRPGGGDVSLGARLEHRRGLELGGDARVAEDRDLAAPGPVPALGPRAVAFDRRAADEDACAKAFVGRISENTSW